MLLVAHRTPRTTARCRDLAGLGVGMFEVDVQLRPGDDTVWVSHYLPVRPFGRWVQRDNARPRLGYGPPHDPRLADVLARVPDGCRVLLDPKPRDTPTQLRLAAVLADLLTDRARFVVSTDRAAELEAYAAAGFRTWRTIKDRAALQDALAHPRPPQQGVSVRHTTLDAASVRQLSQRWGTVVAWTVNDVHRARQLRDWGVDGVTTDRRAVVADLGANLSA